MLKAYVLHWISISNHNALTMNRKLKNKVFCREIERMEREGGVRNSYMVSWGVDNETYI